MISLSWIKNHKNDIFYKVFSVTQLPLLANYYPSLGYRCFVDSEQFTIRNIISYCPVKVHQYTEKHGIYCVVFRPASLNKVSAKHLSNVTDYSFHYWFSSPRQKLSAVWTTENKAIQYCNECNNQWMNGDIQKLINFCNKAIEVAHAFV